MENNYSVSLQSSEQVEEPKSSSVDGHHLEYGKMAKADDVNDDTSHDAQDGCSEAHEALISYLTKNNDDEKSSPSSPLPTWQRQPCCSAASRYLYCPECYKLLVPSSDWPASIQNGTLQLPFRLHILVDDRRASSTGIQAVSLLQASASNQKKTTHGEENYGENDDNKETNFKLFDLQRNEIPCYKGNSTNTKSDGSNNHPHEHGTYLLFPGPSAIPLSSVIRQLSSSSSSSNTTPPIKTLVVLDCKWSRSSIRDHPYVACLQQVKLDNPPPESYYWRWHNTGHGMMSTVEAIYFAAWQVCCQENKNLGELVDLLWLFRLQRNIIQENYLRNQVRSTNPHAPFTEEAKEFARSLRRQHKNKKIKGKKV